jgi:hypothetical protein
MASGMTLLDVASQFEGHDHLQHFMERVGSLAQLECSEQAIEGDHATMNREVRHSAHHTTSRLSVVGLRAGELEEIMEDDAKVLG